MQGPGAATLPSADGTDHEGVCNAFLVLISVSNLCLPLRIHSKMRLILLLRMKQSQTILAVQ